MNRINKLFNEKKTDILSVYFTAGYPNLADTAEIILNLEDAGADMIEIGFPFSDPMADGPVIQKSNHKALLNGMNLKLLFQQIKEIRDKVKIPLILMGYFNPVYQFGMKNFLTECTKTGIDGVIIPDLPYIEYKKEYAKIFSDSCIHNIFLVTPQTSQERISDIDKQSDGFIYLVSSASTTGAKTGISDSQEEYFKRIKQLNLKNPFLIGFGISNADTYRKACNYANGAIIGSAFINMLGNGNDSLDSKIKKFISGIRQEHVA